jgi:hypothetical protein
MGNGKGEITTIFTSNDMIAFYADGEVLGELHRCTLDRPGDISAALVAAAVRDSPVSGALDVVRDKLTITPANERLIRDVIAALLDSGYGPYPTAN